MRACTTQVRFFEVDESELIKQRKAFASGTLAVKTQQEVFDMRQYNKFVSQPDVVKEVKAMRAKQAVRATLCTNVT